MELITDRYMDTTKQPYPYVILKLCVVKVLELL